jgi:hypothetical protein
MSSHQYEELYGVGLLDDLHNYFPALLYEQERFASVQSVLRYIQQQTRNRFDLFSLGEREYHGRTPSASVSPPPPPPPTTVPSVRVNVPLNDVSGNRILINSNFPASLPRLPTRLANPLSGLQVFYNFPDYEEEEENPLTTTLTAQLLTSLLRLPANPIVRGGAGLDAFLQPVPIRPTPEQIEANTTVGNLVSDEEHACAICQDNLQPEQEGRKLNACGHWFHKHCIDTWLEGNVHCPVCRHDIRGQTPASRTQEDQEADSQ